MKSNNYFRCHFLDVGHGDSTIIEFPDHGKPRKAVFGIIDFGGRLKAERSIATDYLKALIDLRNLGREDYKIAFACVTHPHDDHYMGLDPFLDEFANPVNGNSDSIEQFWDCGFRTTASDYNDMLLTVKNTENIRFMRVSSGSEFDIGGVHIIVLAPSIDLRNRFDTYGIEKNDASIVLKLSYKRIQLILAGDAEFASWGKTTEEFPRTKRIKFIEDALGFAERNETSDQLKCDMLHISHHGSFHGTNLEYLERMKPNRVVISAANDKWYKDNSPKSWWGKFPHPLVIQTLECLDKKPERWITGDDGNVVVTYSGASYPRKVYCFKKRPSETGFQADLAIATEY